MNGKSNVCNADREADPVAKFGEQLSMPHEVMANLPFIATHKGVDSIYAAGLLQIAIERLLDVREVVSAHCRLDQTPVRKAL
jgi:hypothetical protein